MFQKRAVELIGFFFSNTLVLPLADSPMWAGLLSFHISGAPFSSNSFGFQFPQLTDPLGSCTPWNSLTLTLRIPPFFLPGLICLGG